MPVQLNVRAPHRSDVNVENFGNQLGQQLRGTQIDGKTKLNALRDYVDSKSGTAKIRVVNTTKNEDLAFRVKSWGHGKAYRQERTAETLKQLLTHAGVHQDVASNVVNRVLQNNGTYRTATASMIKAILNDPEIASVLHPLPQPPARPVVAPLAIKPLKAPPVSPGDVLASEFKNLQTFNLFKQVPPSARNLFVFVQPSGGKVEFRDLSQCDAHVLVRKGTVIGEDALYEEFGNLFPRAHQNPAPPRTYLLQERMDGQTTGPYLLVPREDLIRNPEFSNKAFTVLATLVPAENENSDSESVQAPRAFVAKGLDQYAVNESQATFAVTSSSKTTTLDDLLTAHGLMTGADLGAGTFGSVKELGSAVGSPTHVVKYFTQKGQLKPLDLEAARHRTQMNEGYAAYLATSRDPQWQQPHVIAPSHYIVGFSNPQQPGSHDLQLIPISELKNAVRSNAHKGGSALKCYGLIMEKAPGQEITKQLETQLTDPSKRAQAARSGLQTLRTLNTRGFVHRDIKPDNLLFDGKDVSFIDTGMLFKIKKTDADKPNAGAPIDEQTAQQVRLNELPDNRMGTPLYKHKDLTRGTGYIGTQADLHAFGLVVLQMEEPKVLDAMIRMVVSKLSANTLAKNDLQADPAVFRQRLVELIGHAKSTKNTALLTSAQALQKNIDNPAHLANLGFQCLEKADTDTPEFTAARWADRQFSDAQYAQLLNHPAARQIH
jgi:serine/threonine protein kinase